MTLKEQFAIDLDIFVELEEFAEEVTIDGVTLKAQKLSSTAEKSARLSEQFDMLHGDYVTLYFKAQDYLAQKKRLPHHGDWVVIDGQKRFDVLSCEEQLGICKLVLSAYRQPFR